MSPEKEAFQEEFCDFQPSIFRGIAVDVSFRWIISSKLSPNAPCRKYWPTFPRECGHVSPYVGVNNPFLHQIYLFQYGSRPIFQKPRHWSESNAKQKWIHTHRVQVIWYIESIYINNLRIHRPCRYRYTSPINLVGYKSIWMPSFSFFGRSPKFKPSFKLTANVPENNLGPKTERIVFPSHHGFQGHDVMLATQPTPHQRTPPQK